MNWSNNYINFKRKKKKFVVVVVMVMGGKWISAATVIQLQM